MKQRIILYNLIIQMIAIVLQGFDKVMIGFIGINCIASKGDKV